MKRTLLIALLLTSPALAQINAGEQAPVTDLPFVVTKVADFDLPWRMAFLPDGQMLITEKAGKLFIVKSTGEKMEVTGVPAVQFAGQNGLLGVYLTPTYAKDHEVYLTYSEPGEILRPRASRSPARR